MNDHLAKTFGLQTIPKVKKDVPEINDDFLHAREQLIETITNCKTTVDQLMQLADQSQAPRYFEVLNATMKTLVDASKSLLEIQKQVRDINRNDEGAPHATTTNNLWVGSSADLLSLLKEVKNVKDTT